MPASVVDASVLGAWCFREPRADEAFDLLKGRDLYAPYLLAYEVTSIARRKVTRYAEHLNSIVYALQVALALRINWYDTDHLEVLKLALKSNLTTYDASYLYLARELGLPLITFDQRLARASEASGT